jgi:predicted nucleic acid-binding Zn ribbon protein
MSRRAPRPFAAAVADFTAGLAPASILARTQSAWESAVGATVAGACRPVAEREGTLTVACTEAVWAHELQLMSDAVIERLNATLGGPVVQHLRCRVG